MARNRLDLGLAAWKAELEAEPEALAGVANPQVSATADDAAQALRAAYPLGPTGRLKGGVRVDRDPTSGATAAATVVSGAPHAHLYEDGTHVARPHPTFDPITNAHGRALVSPLNALVTARGYRVSGMVD